MKWYSVKKYRPPYSVMELIVYNGMSIKHAECCAMSDGSYEFYKLDMDSTIIEGVTHFCIPEPIEIEE